MTDNNEFRFGYVALIGKPNVGKSTLLNALLGEKLSIVTPKAQTTRNRITGILTQENFQIVFLDTPGIFKPSSRLQHIMVENAMGAASEADILVLMVEAYTSPDQFMEEIAARVKQVGKDTILVINKIDKVRKDTLLPLMSEYHQRFGFEEIVPVSALKKDGVVELLDVIVSYLPPGEMHYAADQISDMPERFFIAEMIREKLFMQTQQEIPYSTIVKVNEVKERENGTTYVRATIYVERESQKAIVIGKKGAMLRKIGKLARTEIQKWMDSEIYLDIWVRTIRSPKEIEYLSKNPSDGG